MSKIIIKREPSYLGSARSSKIILDGTRIGVVKNGETATFDVSPGRHSIKMGYGLLSGMSRTVEFNVNSGEDIPMTLKTSSGLVYGLMIPSVICGYLIANAFLNDDTFLLFILTVILCFLQYISSTQMLKIQIEAGVNNNENIIS